MTKVTIDGGYVECIEGLRVWARTEDGREVLILVSELDATTTTKLR